MKTLSFLCGSVSSVDMSDVRPACIYHTARDCRRFIRTLKLVSAYFGRGAGNMRMHCFDRLLRCSIVPWLSKSQCEILHTRGSFLQLAPRFPANLENCYHP